MSKNFKVTYIHTAPVGEQVDRAVLRADSLTPKEARELLAKSGKVNLAILTVQECSDAVSDSL